MNDDKMVAFMTNQIVRRTLWQIEENWTKSPKFIVTYITLIILFAYFLNQGLKSSPINKKFIVRIHVPKIYELIFCLFFRKCDVKAMNAENEEPVVDCSDVDAQSQSNYSTLKEREGINWLMMHGMAKGSTGWAVL